jgi:hypothetical protein
MLLGAIGVMVEGREALLHSEAILLSEDTDVVRECLWRRIQNLARTQGAHRVWTQEDAPFWITQGFVHAAPEDLENHQASFLDSDAEWRVTPLVDPAKAQAIIQERMAVWETQRLEESAYLQDRVRRWKGILWIVAAVLLASIVGGGSITAMKNPAIIVKIKHLFTR